METAMEGQGEYGGGGEFQRIGGLGLFSGSVRVAVRAEPVPPRGQDEEKAERDSPTRYGAIPNASARLNTAITASNRKYA